MEISRLEANNKNRWSGEGNPRRRAMLTDMDVVFHLLFKAASIHLFY